MGEIGSDARSVDNIVKGELVDQWAGLQEKGERLRRNNVSTDLAA